MAKSWRGKKNNKNNKANWMVSYSAKLDSRTKQHTQFGVSASNGSRDMARTKVAEKKLKKKKKNERQQSHKASPTGIANNHKSKSNPVIQGYEYTGRQIRNIFIYFKMLPKTAQEHKHNRTVRAQGKIRSLNGMSMGVWELLTIG